MTEDWPFYSLVQFLPLTFELGRKGGREGETSVSLQVSRPTKWKFWELLKVIYLTHEPESQEGSKKGWGEAQMRCGGKSLTASKSLGLVPSWGPAKPRSLGSVRHPCVLGVTFKILNDGTGKQFRTGTDSRYTVLAVRCHCRHYLLCYRAQSPEKSPGDRLGWLRQWGGMLGSQGNRNRSILQCKQPTSPYKYNQLSALSASL